VKKILKTVRLIEKQASGLEVPSVTQVSKRRDPYQVLISCILSLRTKDKTTITASRRLFKVASAPGDMIKLSSSAIQRLIYPVGFYRKKARDILGVSRKIIKDSGGRVPNRLEGLLSLKGVGRKTANLVLGLGYCIPAICVDTHVHRISNRLGWVKTNAPVETEEALKKIIPEDYWINLNTLLVTFGQNVCLPVSPYCSRCYIGKFCKKVKVFRFR